jgi:hypothetical protein
LDDCCFDRDRLHDQPDLIMAECDVDGSAAGRTITGANEGLQRDKTPGEAVN